VAPVSRSRLDLFKSVVDVRITIFGDSHQSFLKGLTLPKDLRQRGTFGGP
jgi:hypothetical protein